MRVTIRPQLRTLLFRVLFFFYFCFWGQTHFLARQSPSLIHRTKAPHLLFTIYPFLLYRIKAGPNSIINPLKLIYLKQYPHSSYNEILFWVFFGVNIFWVWRAMQYVRLNQSTIFPPNTIRENLPNLKTPFN